MQAGYVNVFEEISPSYNIAPMDVQPVALTQMMVAQSAWKCERFESKARRPDTLVELQICYS